MFLKMVTDSIREDFRRRSGVMSLLSPTIWSCSPWAVTWVYLYWLLLSYISISSPVVFSVHRWYRCIIPQSGREHFPSGGVWGSTRPLDTLAVSRCRMPTTVTLCRMASQSGSAASDWRATVLMSLIGISSTLSTGRREQQNFWEYSSSPAA